MDEFDDVLNQIDEELQPLQEMARIENVGNFFFLLLLSKHR